MSGEENIDCGNVFFKTFASVLKRAMSTWFWIVQGDPKVSVQLMVIIHVFLASLLGPI
jgi:hypothetical protein